MSVTHIDLLHIVLRSEVVYSYRWEVQVRLNEDWFTVRKTNDPAVADMELEHIKEGK